MIITIFKKMGLAKSARLLRRYWIIFIDFIGYLFFSFLPRNTDYFSKDKIKKVLIIRTDRIGDLILSAPAIRSLRKAYPDAKIHLLISGYTRDIVVNNPNIDRLLILGVDKIEKDYDLAIALYRGISQNFLAFKSGAQYRFGFAAEGGGFFLTHKLKNEKEILNLHEVMTCLELSGLAGGADTDRNLEVSVTKAGEKYAEDFYKQNGILSSDRVVIVHPGARQDYIRWKKEGFAEVADRLTDKKNMKVILIGSKNEKQLIDEVKSTMKKSPVLAIGLELTQLISVIKKAALFIGNSTGPMHIAAALDVPTVAIFGSQHPQDSYEKWGPWSEKSIVVKAPINCPDCHPSDCRNFKCMKLISKDIVYNAAVELLRKCYGI